MPKLKDKCHLQVFDYDDVLCVDELLETSKAFEKFRFYVECSMSVGFHLAKRFRLVSGGHILYEFRDVRYIVNQNSLML